MTWQRCPDCGSTVVLTDKNSGTVMFCYNCGYGMMPPPEPHALYGRPLWWDLMIEDDDRPPQFVIDTTDGEE